MGGTLISIPDCDEALELGRRDMAITVCEWAGSAAWLVHRLFGLPARPLAAGLSRVRSAASRPRVTGLLSS